MSTENLAKFSTAVATDPTLAAKIQALHAEGAHALAETVAALAAEKGLPFTVGEFQANVSSQLAELSDEQLSQVAGGAWQPNIFNVGISIVTLGAGCLFMAVVSKNERGDIDRCQLSGDPTDLAPKRLG